MAVAALLFTGCKKDDALQGTRIMEEKMLSGNGSKVVVDVNNPSANSWVVGENIGYVMDGVSSSKKIESDGDGHYINLDITGPVAAWYPAEYGQPTEEDEVISYLSAKVKINPDLDYSNIEHPKIQFPMVAFGNDGSTGLMFSHATAAVAFTVTNNTGETQHVSIARVGTKYHSNGEEAYIWPILYGIPISMDYMASLLTKQHLITHRVILPSTGKVVKIISRWSPTILSSSFSRSRPLT